MTTEEMLNVFDKGDTIWSVEMGGLGPGYEQAIQLLIVELVRDLKDAPLPESHDDQRSWGDATVHRIDQSCGGFSGAQVGAAKHIAYRIVRDGYDGFLEKARAEVGDRMIQVSKHWPKVEA